MRARMSDPDKRERWLSYMETHYTATVEETGVTPEDWVLNMALAEARSILADVETTHPEHWTLYDSRGRHEGFNSAIYAERLALAESLRSFVEGN